jgi:hypothetical protein
MIVSHFVPPYLFIRYESAVVEGNVIKPMETKLKFKTDLKVPKVGVHPSFF